MVPFTMRTESVRNPVRCVGELGKRDRLALRGVLARREDGPRKVRVVHGMEVREAWQDEDGAVGRGEVGRVNHCERNVMEKHGIPWLLFKYGKPRTCFTRDSSLLRGREKSVSASGTIGRTHWTAICSNAWPLFTNANEEYIRY